MYETWYKMTVMLKSGLDIKPAITDRFGFRDFAAAFTAAPGRFRQGHHGLDVMSQLPDPLAFLADEVANMREFPS